jgi:ribosomal protein L40E
MRPFHIGLPQRESFPKDPIFLHFRLPHLHYNGSSSLFLLPPIRMPSNRHNLILDEQAFQGLLSAAFIVQEYNDRQNNNRLKYERLKWARQQQAEPEAPPIPKSESACRHCGAPKPSEVSQCESCGRDEFRPGERLQRNWASMWLMSQEHDLWPEHSRENGGGAQKDVPEPKVERQALRPTDTSVGHAANRFPQHHSAMGEPTLVNPLSENPADTPTVAASTPNQPTPHTVELDNHTLGSAVYAGHALRQAEAERASSSAALDEAMESESESESGHVPQESFAFEVPDRANRAVQSLARDDSSPLEISRHETSPMESSMDEDESDEPPSGDGGDGDGNNRSLIQRLAGFRVILRVHRSNLYLAGAVLVAALALLWPVADSPRRPALSPLERMLVAMGLAEVPEPVVHLQGDPSIEVWVDPHTALYYCPGEELYGKTADGRLSSQHEAQMDRFEPAGRSTCE